MHPGSNATDAPSFAKLRVLDPSAPDGDGAESDRATRLDEHVDRVRGAIGERRPGAAIVVLPGSGHFPHIAHPKQFAETLAATSTWANQPLAAAIT